MNLRHRCRTINRRSFRTPGSVKSIAAPTRSTPVQSSPRIGRTSGLDCSRSTVLTVRISFHPEATAEFEASADWYAERSPRAARDFCVAVDVALASIGADPDRFVRIDNRHRSCSVQKFPFQIVFCHDDDRIHIVAVAHAKRRPGYWRDR
ncbi:MAG TPA: type II toxin-antitoxin system RelE/ParE family toxin [Planctomycetaceae bacterium]|nr:type II toxin-antitoxin system RelE/ParE family toxin [Planctomycetaceae bacterium]